MKKIQFLLILLLSALAIAQNGNRKFIKHKQNPLNLEVSVSDGTYRIVFYTPEIVETTFLLNGERYNPESHAVVLAPNAVTPNLKESKNSLKYMTSGITVEIKKSPFQIVYHYQEKELLSEKNGYTQKPELKGNKPQTLHSIDFNLNPDEALYGGGARVLGLNRRGNRLELYNRAHYGYETRAELMNFCIPLAMSSKIYAVHFDNPAIGYLDLDSKKNNTLSYETISGRKTYQVIAADSWPGLISNYTLLTGRQPLPPRWAFGNFASRFGYRDHEMAATTARHFKEKQIPVDAMIFDLYWFGKTIKGTMGNLEFDKDNFPDPKKMMLDLTTQGIKPILITEPFILTTSKKWQEAVDKKILATDAYGKPFIYDFYFGNTGIIDIFKPEARNWFWNIYKDLANLGAAGVWGDLGEPEVFPSEAITAKGKADEVHNIYGHEWAKLVFEGYKKDFPDQRPFILMRAGYSGSQRFGMIPWSGDVSRSWGGLAAQPEIAIEMGMQGLAYMHSDLGGFAGEYNDNELYLRWLQYGVFQPIFRPHAQELVPSEPVFKDIITMEKAKKIIELRYQLMPYNYSMAAENSVFGLPLMRPLFFDEPEKASLFNKSDSYFWGDAFLVRPIVQPGVKDASVYFPKSDNWFDFYSDEKHSAGSTKNILVSEDHIPVFVRSNSFVPMIKTIQNTTAYSIANLDVHFYFDPERETGMYSLYNDDGLTPEPATKKLSEIVSFTSQLNGKTLKINISNMVHPQFATTDKTITLIAHNLTAKKVTVNGKNSTFKVVGKTIEIPVNLEKGGEKDIQIEL